MAYDSLIVLADPTRKAILELIAARPRSVADLTRGLPISQPAVSQHLKILREARLVRLEPRGARHIYHVDAAGLGQISAWLDRMWAAALHEFKAEADKQKEKKR